MSQSFCSRAVGAGSAHRAGLRALLTLTLGGFALAGCGSTAPVKPAGHPSAAVTQPQAAPSPKRAGPVHRAAPAHKSTAHKSTARATSPASAPCPTGQRRTATGLCYDPAAQTRLVKKLGPCLAGQVVADNGACQPLSSRRPGTQPALPLRCLHPKRAGCVPQGSLQGGGLKTARGPTDGVFH